MRIENERNMLQEWNRTDTGYPWDRCVHELFEQQAAETPDSAALICGEAVWTYSRLNERANQIAQNLRELGVQPDSIVALKLERSAETIAAILGVLKAGGAYAPLSPNDPPARLEALLHDLKPVTLVGQDGILRPVDNRPPEVNRVAPNSRNLAYVMFTSGSTGTPKGVMVEHRSVVRLVRNTNYVTLDDKQVFLQLAPLAFDASTFEIWGALLNGSALAIMPAAMPSLAEVAHAIEQFHVTTLWLTAGLFHSMVDHHLESLAHVKQLLAGGDVLSPSHVRRFLDAAPSSRLINGYGPTEGTTFTCCYSVPAIHPADAPVPIGRPISNTRVYILDSNLQPVGVGETGELYAAGDGIARGYLARPELTAEKFLHDPFSREPGARMYRTGDLARFRPDGVVEFLGRADNQVKLQGFRVETGEIETLLNQHRLVAQSAVVLREGRSEQKTLLAYVAPSNCVRPEPAELRDYLKEKLPAYMVPAQFIVLDTLPLNTNGKVDRAALLTSSRADPLVCGRPPGRPRAHTSESRTQRIVSEAWSGALGIASPDLDTPFFDLGGTSLLLLQVQAVLNKRTGADIAVQDLFRFPTIRSLAAFLDASTQEETEQTDSRHVSASRDIAIVGMAGRFPGAKNVREFWENLKNGIESIATFTDDEVEAGNEPGAVKARPILDDADLFDAAHFGILPKEAEVIDPQHRIFLESCVEALEDAACDPARYHGSIGVFAGCSPNTYFLQHLCTDREFVENYTGAYQVGNYVTMLGTSPDFLTTRVSYKLNLTGPSVTLGTACSTSLVAITQACDNLLAGHCDAALAGGVSITFPQKRAYRHQEGGLASSDGHCRTFDEAASGTVFGSGCAVVVLKRLEDAVRDGDSIYAVIKGYGINNDGAGKIGFTAPSVEGQADAIRKAQLMAGVDPASITYIEAHGTATPLGDPIEIAALTQAFRESTQANQFCAIGSAKTNVGHLDAAAGITGLIKTALSIRHGQLPPTLHFNKPNPRIDFANSPFYVNDKLAVWKPAAMPRRAGVSAFGVGGTNAHVILEQAVETVAEPATLSHHLLPISAKTPAALDEATSNLAAYIKSSPDTDLADMAYTLQTGRRQFEHRRFIVTTDGFDGFGRAVTGRASITEAGRKLPIAFAFPGQGAQHPGMGSGLYAELPVFRAAVDEAAAILRNQSGIDILAAINGSADELNQTALAQPAIFVVEYALAEQWMSWGIRPQAMLGHSVGEFVAATLAGVFSLEDALSLVAARGRMMQDLPRGVMLSVRAPEDRLRELLTPGVAIAAVNSPALCVASGPEAAIEKLEQDLNAAGIVSKRLRTSHAFHSAMVDPILESLTAQIRTIQLNPPQMPYVSTLTGDWITAAEATSPEYWARHCRETVRFSDAVRRLQQDQPWCVLEAGPGQALSTLVRQHGNSPNEMQPVASMPDASASQPEIGALLTAAGRLWLAGNELDWAQLYAGQKRHRVSLPTYPFERKRYWVEAKKIETRTEPMTTATVPVAAAPDRKGRLQTELINMLEELSGMDLGNVAEATFLEMGFDSLFLTQVTQSIESKFGVKIRFARLLDDLSTINAVVAALDSQMPADPAPVAAPIAPVAAAPAQVVTSAAPASAIEQLFQQQIQAFTDLTSRQLEALKSMGAQAPTATPAAPVVATAPAPTTAPTPAAPAPAKYEAFGPYKPINKGVTGGLSAQQEAYLAAFIERYAARTRESKRLTQEQRARLADPRVASGFRAQWKEIVYPIHIVRSEGSKLWDADGNEYIDILNGFGVTMFGHRPPFVQEAIEKQVREGFEIGPQTPLAGEVASMICEFTGMERATFCNTGSEAVMAALRLARTVTNKNKICFFAGDYHGAFDEVLVKAAGKPGGAPRCRPIAPGIPDEKAANVMILEYGSPASLEIIRAHAHELAAVMVEPVQSRHPNLQPVEFLRELRAITAQSNTALIFDEVVTGFRTHPGGAQALFNIRADLATYGKVIGGGLPVGVLAGSSKFMDALDGGAWQFGDDSSPEVGVTFFAGTFVRHPLAMAATKAVLEHMKAAGPRLQDEISAKAGRLVRALNEMFQEGNVPAKVENFRSIFYFGFPADQRFASLLYYHVREKGVHIQEGFPCFLTTAHSDEDIDKIIAAFRDSIAEMHDAGFFAPSPTRVPAVACEAPLTEAQMEIRLSAQLGDEESCAYNEGFTIHLEGALDESVLRDSLQTVVDRHEALRATLTESGDALRIQPRLKLEIPVIDLTSFSAEQQRERLEHLKEEDARIAFDLLHGPLVRAKLIRLFERKHALVITAHHIICDGWSTNVLLDELSKLYSARHSGKSCELPVPMRFSDYATAQSGRGIDAAVEAYWVSEYTEPVAPLELPLDRPRPALKSYRGSTHVAKIDAGAYQAIKKAGAQRGSTLFSTLLSGFQTLLARLTGQTDIVVGIPSAAQSTMADTTLVGHCVNFLPIRVQIGADEKFSDVLTRSRRKLLEAYEHQSYTYGTLVRKLAIPRNPSRLPLIEVQFNLERVGTRLNFDGLQAQVEQSPKRFVNFDIFMNVVESPDGLTIYCDYNTDLFDDATIARWLKHYEALLTGFATDLRQMIGELPLLSESDRKTILADWNDTMADYPRNQCIHQAIEQQAAATPESIAVVYGDSKLTYSELVRRFTGLALWLKQQGVQKESLVGISIEPSLEMLVAVLGVLKAGGAYVPLDPNYPQERLEFIKEDAGLSLILTASTVEQAFPPALGAAEFPAPNPGQLAYVMYTSGSTGKPKGVEINHRAVMNFLTSMRREPGIAATDRLLAVTTLSFDIAGLEIFLPLISGAQVVIAGRDATRDGKQLMDLIDSAAITMMQATPTTWKLLLEAGWSGKSDLKMLCGGEELTRELANEVAPRGASLWNMYGPTETTIWSSTCQITAGNETVSIGRPIANTQIYILDTLARPVPVGVPGELYIGGDGLARGYWNRSELTAEKFVRNPFVADANARMYRTGDLAKFLPDGRILCLGRIDNQVKIRGHRIELGEIESALRTEPGVKDAAVIVREDVPGEKRLAAYVIPAKRGLFEAARFRNSLANRLPAYMVPALFVEQDALPLTPNGKIDRKALAALPAPSATPAASNYVAPKTEQEKILSQIWQEVLRVDRAGIHDDLFALGADSIHLFQISSRAAKQGLAISPKQLLQNRTIARLLNEAADKPAPASTITRVSRENYRVKRAQ